MRISVRSFYIAALAYLGLPVIIFFFGFIKVLPAVVLTAALLLCAFLAVRREGRGNSLEDNGITITIREIVLMAVVFALWAFLSGIGGIVWQTEDYAVRNAVMNDLVNYKWPIFYDTSLQENPLVREALSGDKAAFSYYFTFWMPAAVVGKLFGIAAGRVMLYIWTVIGLMLIGTGAKLLNKKFTWISVLMLIFFGGMDIIFVSKVPNLMELENWDGLIKYMSNCSQMGNIFNQCIPYWLIVIMLMLTKNSESLGLYGALTFCYSPWATIGMLPIAICRLFQNGKKFRNYITVENILAPVAIFVGFGFMYMSNSSSTSVKGFIWKFYDSLPVFILAWILLLAVDVLPYFLFLFKEERKNSLFIVVFAVLLLTPLYRITFYNDFCMRVSAPALFVLCLMAMNKAEKIKSGELNITRKNKLLSAAAGVIIMLSSATFIFTVIINSLAGITSYSHEIESFGNIKNADYAGLVEEQFYVYNYEDTVFYKYLSK